MMTSVLRVSASVLMGVVCQTYPTKGSVVMLPIHDRRPASKVAALGEVRCPVRMPACVAAMTAPSRGALVAM